MRPESVKKHYYDYSLVFIIIFLTVFGLIMIYSSSSYTAQLKYGNPGYYAIRQGAIAAVGFVLMIIVSLIDYHFILRFAPFLYVLSYVLMIATSIFGKVINGKRRWLEIGPVSFQPTEVVKIALIVFLAVLIKKMGKAINTWKGLGIVALFTIPIATLVGLNNLSSGIIVLGIGFVMSFIATNKKGIFAVITAVVAVIVIFADKIIAPIAIFLNNIGLLRGYQLTRILVWLEPEAYPLDGGYQVLQGLYAIGSGGIVGKGLGESIQKLGFVPEAQNDMIFSIICEELGLFGAISVILIFMFMIYRFMVIANSAPDTYGKLIVIGVMVHIAIQVILNIAVVSNVIPNTGITLPFISYGGTSVLLLMVEMGLVLGVSRSIILDYR